MADGRRGPVQSRRYPDGARMNTVAADEIIAAKQALRASSRERRRCAREAAAPDAGEAAARHFLASIDVSPGCVVSGYWPMGDEFDVRPLLRALHARGHPCGLPVVVVRGRPLVFRAWTPETALVPAEFGTSVPPADAPEVVPRMLLVPLLAFDVRGVRLGYGGGFYDMTLAHLRAGGPAVVAVGVGFAAQRVDRVPCAATDQRLDWLLTEAGAVEAA